MAKFKLSNIETEEVSLVPKGANNKKFFLIKSKDGDKVVSVSGLIEKLMSESSDEKVLDGVEPEVEEIARVAKHLIQTLRDTVSGDNANQFFQSLLKEEQGEKPMADEQEKEVQTPEAKQDEGAKAPEAAQAEGGEAQSAEVVEKAVKENVQLRKELETLQKKFKDSEDKRITKEFIEEAKQFDNLSISAEELGPVLKSVKESAPAAYETLHTVLKSANEMLKQNEILKVHGSDSKVVAGSAEDKLEKLADAYIAKSDKPIKREIAMDMVLKTAEGKALYREIGGTK